MRAARAKAKHHYTKATALIFPSHLLDNHLKLPPARRARFAVKWVRGRSHDKPWSTCPQLM